MRDWETRWLTQSYSESLYLTRKSKSPVKPAWPSKQNPPIFCISVFIHHLYTRVPIIFNGTSWVPMATKHQQKSRAHLLLPTAGNCCPSKPNRSTLGLGAGGKSLKPRNCTNALPVSVFMGDTAPFLFIFVFNLINIQTGSNSCLWHSVVSLSWLFFFA